MKLLELNPLFIEEHIDELIILEDWVPVSFVKYDKQHERNDFLKSKNLLTTMQEMDGIILQKCSYHDNPVKAYNSVLIEWMDLHPEFEGIISNNSFADYQNKKINNDYIEFIEFLDFVILPSERISKERGDFIEDVSIKDDSCIQLPDFDKIEKIYLKYPNTLLADYLSYLV